MARGSKSILFLEVEVLEQFTSKKGTKCTKVGWNSSASSGQELFFGEDDLVAIPVGSIITINASQSGDFYRCESVEVLGKPRARAAA